MLVGPHVGLYRYVRILSVPLVVQYEYMYDLTLQDASQLTVPARLPPAMEEVHCPLPWQEWDHSLATHSDEHIRQYIMDGLCYGFQVAFNYHHQCQESLHNMSSALEHPQVIRDYLAEECSVG